MEISKKRYDNIKHSFGMWMYESLMNVEHITHYNFEKIGIGKFKRAEIIQMGLAIFDKRVELEFMAKEIETSEEVVECQTKS